MARPRPLRALGRPRLGAPLRAAAPDAATTCRWSSSSASASSARRPRATPSAATPRAWRSPPARWGRASPTRSASRWPRRCWPRASTAPGHEIVDHRTWFICSDGDLMEGISHEAASIAGFLRPGAAHRDLGRQPHQPGRADQPGVRRGRARPASRPTAGGCCAWRTATTSRRSTRALTEAERARRPPDADRLPHPHRLRRAPQAGHLERPRLAARRRGGRGHQARLRLARGRAASWCPTRWRPGGRRSRRAAAALAAAGGRSALAAYAAAYPAEAAELDARERGPAARGLGAASRRAFPAGESIATRASGGKALNAFAAAVPELVQGAADLSSSTSTTLKDMGRRGAAATSRAATSTTASASTRWARSPTASRPTGACGRCAPRSSRSRTT